MKISQEDGILMISLYLSKRYGARRLLHEFPDEGRKRESIDSLLENPQDGYNCLGTRQW